jgi:hypothetical protein
MEMNYNDAELHQIEEEIGQELLPGTEVYRLLVPQSKNCLLI